MDATDKKQQLAINLIVALVGITGAVIGVLAYTNNEKHRKLQQELFAIDKQIKSLELALKTDEAHAKGVI